jgi:hypothetical protein
MHYARKEFSVNGKDTIEPRLPFSAFLNLMGNGNSISQGDAESVKRLYGKKP